MPSARCSRPCRCRRLGGVVGPPYELCAVADFEPAIDGSHVVFLQAAADGAEAFFILVRRKNAAGRAVGIGNICAQGLSVATVVCRDGVDECTFLSDGIGEDVFAYLLVEALYASLVAVQCVCQSSACDVVGVLNEDGLVLVLVSIAVGMIDVGEGDVGGFT